jgi:enoyl-CoA hydratase
MEFKNILFEKKDQVAVLTINLIKKLNALDMHTEEEIGKAMDEIEKDDGLRGVIITGAGEKAFSAGADIFPYLEMTVSKSIPYMKTLRDVLWKVEHLGKPVVAAVNGICLGGGFELALACSLRIASENARFGLPETNLGVIPGNGGSQRLGRLIGKGRALWYLLTTETMDAQEALRLGVVNKVVPQEKLMETCLDLLVNQIFKKPSVAVWAALSSQNWGMEVDLASACQMDIDLTSICMGTEDFREGVKAFVEKRKPQFKGR